MEKLGRVGVVRTRPHVFDLRQMPPFANERGCQDTCLGLENNCGNIKLPRGQTPRIQIDFRYIQIDSACENVSRSNSMIVSFPKYCLAYIYTTEPPKPQIHLNQLIPIALRDIISKQNIECR